MRRGGTRAAVACALAVLGTAACSSGADVDGLVVHSPLPRALLDVAEEAMHGEAPDLAVRIVEADPEATLTALRHGETVDVWWGAPVTALASAADEGLLAAYEPSWWQADGASGAPPAGRRAAGGPIGADPEARWHPTLVSPFVMAFNRDRLALSDAPRDWVDLFHFTLWDEVVLLDPERSAEMADFMGGMIVEALRDDDNLVRGFDWLGRLDRSTAEYVPDTEEIVRRLGTGDALVSILPRHEAEEARHAGAPWLHYRAAQSGTPLLALGVAIPVGAAHPEAARAFVDATGRTDVATAARLLTRWSAVVAVDQSALPADFEVAAPVRSFPLAADTLARELDGWIDRWDVEVRGTGGH